MYYNAIWLFENFVSLTQIEESIKENFSEENRLNF